jgi:hypothetical protein
VAEGYYEAASTPGLWCHKWRPIQFCLLVDNFGVEYVEIQHFNHLLDLLKKFHGVQCNMARDKFAGIDIKWDYVGCRCCISMPDYIKNLLIIFKHPRPTKPRPSPYKCLPIAYGAKAQLTPEADISDLLDDHHKRRIQEIVSLLSTTPERWTTSFWLLSAPSPPANHMLQLPLNKLSISSLTMLLPTLRTA